MMAEMEGDGEGMTHFIEQLLTLPPQVELS
jgi:hypothetical protein